MCLKNFSILAFFALILTVFAQGATISFMVIETGLMGETPAIESSRLWEDALLDVFFDTGHIVSNTPIVRISEKPQKNLPDEAKISLNEAAEGGAEFFVVAVLDYQNLPGAELLLLKPRSVSLRLFKTEPYRFLYSQEYTPTEIRITDSAEMANAMSAARKIAAHLKD
ncbi:MAG: hypothetical protein LBB68_01990 [Treponema sp.]|jgi:hypothetical protein|nr:hypothetical protein [Treponema sp.]